WYLQAEKTLRKAIYQAPELAQAHTNLGNTFNLTGQYEEAITHYLTALKINPSLITVYLTLANIYTQKVGDEKKARYYLKQAELFRSSTQHTNTER
ncbi:MAG: tetratricopeptide repeat protein, partial [Deltaproteobacteria bacterium]|nr:tetratricopeptide repeat protein [Deltaproteobacteria bacterium]